MASFIKDFFSVGISKGLIILFGLCTSIVTARFIGPEGNGVIAALLVYPSLFMSFGSLGISQSTTYFLGKKIYSEEQIKRAITQIWLITTIVAIIVCFVLMRYYSKTGQNNLSLVFIALLPIPFTLFNTYNSGIFLGKNDIKTYNKINWIPAFVVCIGTVVFVILLLLGVTGAMIALILGPIFMSVVLLFKNKFIQAFSIHYEWVIIKRMLSLGIVYATALIIINLNYKIDVIILDKLSTEYQLGIYSKGAGITEYLWQIPALFSPIVFARSATSKKGKEFSMKVAQLLRVSLILVGAASLFLIFLSKYIILLMYGESFLDSVQVLNYLLPGVLILTLYKVMNMDLAGKGKPWVAAIAMIPALILNIVLNILFVPKFGADGAAISSTFSYALAGFLFIYLYCRQTKIPLKEIFYFKKSDFAPIINMVKKIINQK